MRGRFLATMNRGNISALTEAQKVCLRHVNDHLSSKDIARVIGISPHTVDTHIRTAIKLLDAKNRFDAAQMLKAYEAKTDQGLSNQFPRLSELESSVKIPAPVTQREQVTTEHVPRSKLLPLPEFWGDRHDLSNAAKLGWIVLLAIYICISIGALVALFDAVNGFYRPR